MPRKTLPPRSTESIREQVEREIPYVVGNGTKCLQERTRRIKQLMQRQGIPLEVHAGIISHGPDSGHTRQSPRWD